MIYRTLLLSIFTATAWAQIEVSLPDLRADPGEPLQIALTLGDTGETGIRSFSITLVYDESVLTVTDVSLTGTVVEGWSLAANFQPGVLTLSGAGATNLAGPGTLIRIMGRAGAAGVSALTLEHLVFNEGLPQVLPHNGVLTVTGAGQGSLLVRIGEKAVDPGATFELDVSLSGSGSNLPIYSFEARLVFNPAIVSFEDVSLEGGIFSYWSLAMNNTKDGVISLSAAGVQGVQGQGLVFRLQGSALKEGLSNISFETFAFNEGEPAVVTRPGKVLVDLHVASPIAALGSASPMMGQAFSLPLSLSNLAGTEIRALSLEIFYDPDRCRILTYKAEGTLSDRWVFAFNASTPGHIALSAASSTPLTEDGVFLVLEGVALAAGNAVLTMDHLQFNEGNPIGEVQNGEVIIEEYSPPEVLIRHPESDLVVMPGETVQLEGQADALPEQYPLQYNWSFDGAAEDRYELIPGAIFFEEPGSYRITFRVADRFGRESVETRTITVRSCPTPSLPASIPQGLMYPEIQARFNCDEHRLSWFWRTATMDAFGHNINPCVLPDFLDVSEDVEFVVLENGTEVFSVSTRVLVSRNQRFNDFDEDGFNTIADILSAAAIWRGEGEDADGDRLVTILDLLYIHAEEVH
ncbi:MAG: cohesin domain-containing protein [Acidobacteriota bacterium]|nr:cohesin domain-containing protein [Acidobacteriota bacterium]